MNFLNNVFLCNLDGTSYVSSLLCLEDSEFNSNEPTLNNSTTDSSQINSTPATNNTLSTTSSINLSNRPHNKENKDLNIFNLKRKSTSNLPLNIEDKRKSMEFFSRDRKFVNVNKLAPRVCKLGM